MSQTELLHATTVAIDGRGVVITGPSGSGKSDLALRLIDRGAALVADDRTWLRAEGDAVVARAPETIRGRIEVRGVGLLDLPATDDVAIALCVELGGEPERLPPPAERRLAGVAVRTMALDPRPASAPIKVELALRRPDMVVA